jgi:decaprenylphospho-beta-D-erythro-pentofuranosid-2-ulose 2-reductase
MSSVLIIGAKSDIAKAVAREYAHHRFDLILAARHADALDGFASDLRIRHSSTVTLKEFDLVDFASHSAFYEELSEKPIGVVIAAGYMSEQSIAQNEWSEALNTINVNYTGAISILNIIANDFERKKSGFIIGISSVAGDRGRKSNYIYGSAKAGFSAYLSGLRNRLFSSGVHVLTVKPGFVATKMTEGMDLPTKLTAQPEEVARHIYKAQQNGKDVLYTKGIWKFIMLIIKHIPETLFKKMSI